jgi:hypothetical protein
VDSHGPVTIYVDSSGSMTGYIDGATESARPLHDLLATLPGQLAGESSSVDFKAFGSRIRILSEADRRLLSTRGFYSCSGAASGCDNRDTRLDLVMREIESQRDRLALVVTDMWFSDPASVTTGLIPLADPLKNILADGRAVGVYGIRAPFRGTIYDLPGGGSTQFSGDRPLLLLAIGSTDRVRQFSERMKRSPSAFLARGFSDGSIHQAIFTLDPSRGIERSSQPLRGGADARVRQGQIMNAVAGVRVQQFSIDRGTALRDPAQPRPLPSWEGPEDGAFVRNTVWRGPLAAHLLVWERRGEQCGPSDWNQPRQVDGSWRNTGAQGRARFELDPGAFVGEFRRPGTYLVTAEVARTSLNVPNDATAWLRAWSFGPQQQQLESNANGPALFRTLNLAEFSRLLEDALADAAERRPGPIIGFTFVVRVDG